MILLLFKGAATPVLAFKWCSCTLYPAIDKKTHISDHLSHFFSWYGCWSCFSMVHSLFLSCWVLSSFPSFLHLVRLLIPSMVHLCFSSPPLMTEEKTFLSPLSFPCFGATANLLNGASFPYLAECFLTFSTCWKSSQRCGCTSSKTKYGCTSSSTRNTKLSPSLNSAAAPTPTSKMMRPTIPFQSSIFLSFLSP